MSGAKLMAMQAECDAYNARHAVGDTVRYWTGLREGAGREGRIRFAAQIMGGHAAVVYLDGVGAVALSHVEDISAGRRLELAAPAMLDALRQHAAWQKMPKDQGNQPGPKGMAWAAFIEARDAVIARAEGRP